MSDWIDISQKKVLLNKLQNMFMVELVKIADVFGVFEDAHDSDELSFVEMVSMCSIITCASFDQSRNLQIGMESMNGTMDDVFERIRTVKSYAHDKLEEISQEDIRRHIKSFPIDLLLKQYSEVVCGEADNNINSIMGVLRGFDCLEALLMLNKQFTVIEDAPLQAYETYGEWCLGCGMSMFNSYIEHIYPVFPYLVVVSVLSQGSKTFQNRLLIRICETISKKDPSELKTEEEKYIRLFIENVLDRETRESLFNGE